MSATLELEAYILGENQSKRSTRRILYCHLPSSRDSRPFTKNNVIYKIFLRGFSEMKKESLRLGPHITSAH